MFHTRGVWVFPCTKKHHACTDSPLKHPQKPVLHALDGEDIPLSDICFWYILWWLLRIGVFEPTAQHVTKLQKSGNSPQRDAIFQKKTTDNSKVHIIHTWFELSPFQPTANKGLVRDLKHVLMLVVTIPWIQIVQSMVFLLAHNWITALPKTNISIHIPWNRPFQRKLVFQPPFFRGYVSFREGTSSLWTIETSQLWALALALLSPLCWWWRFDGFHGS